MGFYYLSFVSGTLFAIYFLIVALFIVKVCGAQGWIRNCLLAVAFIAPWAEEISIAHEFGQLCRKDAGKLIVKTVKVDGYYDDTGVTRLPPESPYRFIESRDREGKFHRFDRASPSEKEQALKWYAEGYKGKRFEKGKNEWIKPPVFDRTQVIVEIDTGYAWRDTKLDKPTARYHYSRDPYGVQVGHKIFRQEYRVLDSIAGEIIGKLVIYSREAYWFYIGLSAPSVACDSPNPLARRSHNLMIEHEVLKPPKS